jgi:Carboxypeptidase regulatory-like domain
MDSLMRVTRRMVPCLVVLVVLTGVARAQSGRCWMEGFVVSDSDWRGLKGATLELSGDPDDARLRSVKLTAKADDAGKYSLKAIPYGDYILRVSAPGHASYRINIYMLTDTLTQLHVKLKIQKSPVQK